MGITAIFGGTFNPLHIGHYEILKALENEPNVKEIFLMPDKIPPHKICDFMADYETRIEMCRIIAGDFKKVKLCLIEFEREGKSYTYDTVKLLKQKYPDKSFAFVCGGDMLISFDKWYKYEDLAKEISFLAFRRTDTDDTEFDKCVLSLSEIGMNIKVMNEKISSVSSTFIRSNFSASKTLLPEKIFNFLKNRGIYNE